MGQIIFFSDFKKIMEKSLWFGDFKKNNPTGLNEVIIKDLYKYFSTNTGGISLDLACVLAGEGGRIIFNIGVLSEIKNQREREEKDFRCKLNATLASAAGNL